ncbi:MAG: polysaccharide biosynthesis/export family protein, partial [Proteobacteria bacterium]|nr:polysaccharide biosynthesis/export family protein [Pseudomonadota bacterium]
MKKLIIKQIWIVFLLFVPLLTWAQEYTVGEGDVLNINVYENKDLSTTVRVSSDGTIRVPLLGELQVEGLSVSQVSAKIEELFADGYLVDPQVDVF